jgi:hypothetical protein
MRGAPALSVPERGAGRAGGLHRGGINAKNQRTQTISVPETPFFEVPIMLLYPIDAVKLWQIGA